MRGLRPQFAKAFTTITGRMSTAATRIGPNAKAMHGLAKLLGMPAGVSASIDDATDWMAGRLAFLQAAVPGQHQ